MNTLQFFASNPVFSLDEATRVFRPASGRPGAVQRLKHHLTSGRLKLVTRGIYAVVPAGVEAAAFEPDPFLVAQAVRSDAVFSHHSALELLGAAYSVWSNCTAYTIGRRRSLRLAHGSIKFLRHPSPLAEQPDLGTRRVERSGRLLTTTGPERTLLEGFRWPAYAGGLGELLESASSFPVLDLALLERLLSLYGLSILWSASGWFLETYRQTFYVSEEVLGRFEGRRPKSPQYLARGSRGGTMLPRWNLIVPEFLTRRGEADDSRP